MTRRVACCRTGFAYRVAGVTGGAYVRGTATDSEPWGFRMCRAHRFIVGLTVTLWGVVIGVNFGVQPSHESPWRMLLFGVTVTAAVLIPYCLYPWLMRDMTAAQLKDLTGVFLAGWEAAREPEPKEPKRHLEVV